MFIKIINPIKYSRKIIIPVILMLSKKAVDKENKIILFSLILPSLKKDSKIVKKIYEFINQKDKNGISLGFICA